MFKPYFIIRKNGLDGPTSADPDLARAIAESMAEPGDVLRIKVHYAPDATRACLAFVEAEDWATLIVGEQSLPENNLFLSVYRSRRRIL